MPLPNVNALGVNYGASNLGLRIDRAGPVTQNCYKNESLKLLFKVGWNIVDKPPSQEKYAFAQCECFVGALQGLKVRP